MKTMRFWSGTGMFTAACGAVVFAMAPGDSITGSGVVEGRVNYQGRPLAGGFILFSPDDTERCDLGTAIIDEKGHYAIGPQWRREGPGRTRFRICILPNPRNYPTPSPSGEGVATPSPDPSFSPGPNVMAVSMGPGGMPSPGPDPTASDPCRRFSNPHTSGLTVELGPEPARIDITLNDE